MHLTLAAPHLFIYICVNISSRVAKWFISVETCLAASGFHHQVLQVNNVQSLSERTSNGSRNCKKPTKWNRMQSARVARIALDADAWWASHRMRMSAILAAEHNQSMCWEFIQNAAKNNSFRRGKTSAVHLPNELVANSEIYGSNQVLEAKRRRPHLCEKRLA